MRASRGRPTGTVFIIEREDHFNVGTYRESVAWRREWPDHASLDEAVAALNQLVVGSGHGLTRYRIRARYSTGRRMVVWRSW